MLVLSRKSGQAIEIDGGISVQVISVKGNQVKIGIEAPKKVRILRGELSARSGLTAQRSTRLSHIDASPASHELLLQVGPPC